MFGGYGEWRGRGFGDGCDRFIWCGVIGGLNFSLELTGGVEGVANLGAGLGFACSSSGGVVCVWWVRRMVLLSIGRVRDCINQH